VRVARLLPLGATLYACDQVGGYLALARDVVSMAGLSRRVEFLRGTAGECIRKLASRGRSLDFVLIDHDKNDYLPSLKAIEEAGLLEQGAAVLADNVMISGIDDYRDYVRGSHRYESRSMEAALAYTQEGWRDTIEVSHYNASEWASPECNSSVR